jgi:AcrR family transcriptional regulator
LSERRQAILDAALAVFDEHGVEGATIADVRRRSGASVGSIYHHFGGKEELADAVYLEGLRDYQRGILALLERDPDAERGIKGIVRHHLRWVAANPALARFLLRRRAIDEQAVNRDILHATATWFARQVGAGRMRKLPLDVTYALLVGPAHEFSRHWLAGRVHTPIERAQPPLADAAWRALRAEED